MGSQGSRIQLTDLGKMDGCNCGRLEKRLNWECEAGLKRFYMTRIERGLPREISNVNENVRTEKETSMGRMTINGQ